MLIIQLRVYFVLEIALAGVSKQPDVRRRHVARQLVLEMAVAILPSTAICPWNLFCRDHSRVFI